MLGAAFLAVTLAAALILVYHRVLRRRPMDQLVRLSGSSVDANRAFIAGLLGQLQGERHGPQVAMCDSCAP